MAHDNKLTQLIMLEFDVRGERGELITLSDFTRDIVVRYPYREAHPSDQIQAWKNYIASEAKHYFKTQMSEGFVEQYLSGIVVPKKYRVILGRITVGTYIPSMKKWGHTLKMGPCHFDQAADMRIEMADHNRRSAAPYKEWADLLRHTKASCPLDLLSR
jgi:hypothetical protein